MNKKDLGVIVAMAVVRYGHVYLANRLPTLANYGFSFGWQIWLGNWMYGIILLILILVYWRGPTTGVGLMIAGAISNLIDRISLGYVRDYWQLGQSGIYNNLADWFLAIGLVWVVVSTIKHDH